MFLFLLKILPMNFSMYPWVLFISQLLLWCSRGGFLYFYYFNCQFIILVLYPDCTFCPLILWTSSKVLLILSELLNTWGHPLLTSGVLPVLLCPDQLSVLWSPAALVSLDSYLRLLNSDSLVGSAWAVPWSFSKSVGLPCGITILHSKIFSVLKTIVPYILSIYLFMVILVRF